MQHNQGVLLLRHREAFYSKRQNKAVLWQVGSLSVYFISVCTLSSVHLLFCNRIHI